MESAISLLNEYLNTETGEVFTEKELYMDYLTVDDDVKEAFPNFCQWLQEVTGKNGIFEKLSRGYWIMRNGKNYAFCYDMARAENIVNNLRKKEGDAVTVEIVKV